MSADGQGAVIAASVATARAYGVPVAAKSAVVAFDATDKTASLEADSCYMICATAACFIGAADATQAANRIYLPADTPTAIMCRAAFTLHVSQVTGAGNLYVGKVVDA